MGTAEIITAVAQLRQITADIFKSSKIIFKRAETIDDSIKEIVDISSKNTESMKNNSEIVNKMTKNMMTIFNLSMESRDIFKYLTNMAQKYNFFDLSNFKSSDDQPLLIWNLKEKEVPPRPPDPESCPESNAKHWYDIEEEVVGKWLETYGEKLNGIFLTDSFNPLKGCMKAIEKADRKNILIYVTGNNKISLDYMKAGKVHAIRWESAEADVALAVQVAVNWFNGLEVIPITLLPGFIITPDIVDNYYPA